MADGVNFFLRGPFHVFGRPRCPSQTPLAKFALTAKLVPELFFLNSICCPCWWPRARLVGFPMTESVTELEFPFTPAGHRRLLARANHYRNCMRYAWANFYDEVRRSHEQWSEVHAATHALGEAATLEETMQKAQQLIQELGRKCECPVCYRAVLAAEMNPQHPQYMKILHCGHILCGGCAFNIRRTDAPKCPICRHDIQHQLATAQEPREDADSQLRPKRDADDLHVVSPAAVCKPQDVDGLHGCWQWMPRREEDEEDEKV